jgi:hypothetical protein
MPDDREAEVLARYSTPGLQKNKLTRQAKRDHLLSLRMSPDAVDKLLAELYPEGDLPPR